MKKPGHAVQPSLTPSQWYCTAMEQLLGVVQDLSHARDLDTVVAIVREAARNLTGADGATFVLRDNGQCYYVEENAISPLWKGQRFPMERCISGWVMLNAQQAVIEDIYADSRIPADAYRPTFVKSMVMVPVRKNAPIAAIGNYWAKKRQPTPEEIMVLQALADTTSVALENAHLYSQLQEKILALQTTNQELGRFTWLASHDMQEPLRMIVTQLELLERERNMRPNEKATTYMRTAVAGAKRLQDLIAALLVHAQAENIDRFDRLYMGHIVHEAIQEMSQALEENGAQVVLAEHFPAISGNAPLMVRVFINLISNALKFRRDTPPIIRIDCQRKNDRWLFSVTDNGIGIDPAYHEKIFEFAQRLYSQERYPGTGIGLATCKKIVTLHHGEMWVESALGKGSTFCFTFPANSNQEQVAP